LYLISSFDRHQRSEQNNERRNAATTLLGTIGSAGLVFGTLLYLQNRKNRLYAISARDNDDNNKSPRQRFNFIADVVEKTVPSVVYIEIKEMHPFIGRTITVGNGSGFIVHGDGLIVTNAHVVGSRRQVTVQLYDGQKYSGVVEFVDNHLDLATVKINTKNLPALKLGKSSSLRPGEWVVAMGSPFSLTNTITAGVISSTQRQSEDLGLYNKEMDYIQTDAAINVGNSGGPLVNLDSEVIGINSMKVTAGISFAIPSDRISQFLERAEALRKSSKDKDTHSPRKFFLGLTMLSLNPQIIEQIKMQRHNFPDVTYGVLAMKVVNGSPSQKGGLMAGDVITAVNGKEIKTVSEIYKLLDKGEKLNLTILRGKNEKLNIEIVPQPIV
ncbi:serine protease HTRA2: mitochondrial-like isoform X1, partial [Dinothrombium tinctorium]